MKKFKKGAILLIMIAMIVNLFPISAFGATKNPALNTKNINITVGMTYACKVINAPENAKIKWSIADKEIATVSKSGVVKGVNEGNTLLKCKITNKKGKTYTIKTTVHVKVPTFSKKTLYMTAGEKITPFLNNKLSNSTYKWTSSDTKVAKVDSKGKITAKAEGKATISVKIKINKTKYRSAKTLTKKIKVVVSNSITVSDQKSLEDAINSGKYETVTLMTEEKETLTIPEGDFKDIDLIVDAPNADIINKGAFKSITINRIAQDTWTERAKNNVIIIKAVAGHIVLPADFTASEVVISAPGSQITLDVQGTVGKITVEQSTKLALHVSGTVSSIAINESANISIQGNAKESIAINVADTAKGTLINTTSKVTVNTAADTEVNLSKGAEGSLVTVIQIDMAVEVTNNTGSNVSVTAGGKKHVIESGKNSTVSGTGEVTGSTTETPPIGGGGGAISSGDLSRTVSYFKTIPAINAGTAGGTLKTIEEILALLPTTVQAVTTFDETVSYKVTQWVNADSYSPNAKAGDYIFTALLGNPEKPISNPNQKTAEVRIVVHPKSSYIFGEMTNLKADQIAYWDAPEGSEAIIWYKITNTGDQPVCVDGKAKEYDENDYLISEDIFLKPYKRVLLPRESFVVAFFPLNGDKCSRVVIDLSTSSIKENYECGRGDIGISGEKAGTSLNVTLTNNGTRQIKEVTATVVFYNQTGDVIGIAEKRFPNIYGVGYSETQSMRCFEDGASNVIDFASYEVFLTGGEYAPVEEVQQTDILPDGLEAEQIAYWKYPEDSEAVVWYTITNTGDKPICIDGKAKGYDENDYLISEEKIYRPYKGILMPGKTFVVAFFPLNGDKCSRVVIDLSTSSIKENYECGRGDIGISGEKAGTSLNVTLTNNGTRQIKEVTATVVFYNLTGDVIGIAEKRFSNIYGSGYCETQSVKCYEGITGNIIDFASYEVFLTGGEYAPVEEVQQTDILPDGLEAEQIAYWKYPEDSEAVVWYTITNTGDKPICIDGKAKGYDENDYLISEENLYNPYKGILMPGETSVRSFFLLNGNKCSRVVIDLSNSSIQETYECGRGDIAVSGEKTGTSLSLTLTNNGTRQIKEITATVVFRDQIGSVIGIARKYFANIYGAGYSETQSVKCYDSKTGNDIDFISYEIFLNGGEYALTMS